MIWIKPNGGHKKNKILRLELTVMANNKAALALYRKMGFEIEGKKQHSLFINGSCVDEYCMAKLLEKRQVKR